MYQRCGKCELYDTFAHKCRGDVWDKMECENEEYQEWMEEHEQIEKEDE